MVHSLWKFCLIWLLLLSGCTAADVARPTPGARVRVLGTRQYSVRQQIRLANIGAGQPEKQNLWVALISDFAPYQSVERMTISPPGYTIITDEYGNRYAEFDFSRQPAGTSKTVTIEYRVTVNDLAYNLSGCQGTLKKEYTLPELHIESGNPQIVRLAVELAQGKASPCEQVRAFYDYAGEHLTYTDNGKNWGAQAALGPMGADCTEYADLVAALSRAKGIPARYFEGLLFADTNGNSAKKIEHAWVDVELPRVGWTALDPTLGRTLALRDAYFAHYTPDHIIVTLGASPSVLRGSSYWTHLYWPGDSTKISVAGDWEIDIVQ